MPLHPLVVVQKCMKNGHEMMGLFASGPIARGTCVWEEDPLEGALQKSLVMTRAQLLAHPESSILKRYANMVDHDAYETTLDPTSDPAWLFNHACSGDEDGANCW